MVFLARAFFPFQAAAARAGIVAADLFLASVFDRLLDVIGNARRARLSGLQHLFALRFFAGAQLHRQHHARRILADGIDHRVEHIKALDSVFDDRILLAVSAQPDTALQLFAGVDVIHPLRVHVLQQDHALQFAANLRAPGRWPLPFR